MNGTYQKYGINPADPADGLQAMQTATANGFKSALADVDNLRKTVEEGYVKDNTLKLQDYLRSNIKNAGLGADVPEIDQISRQFGKLIDTDTLGKTITATRGQMVNSAVDEAGGAAGAAFGQNEDLGEATGAFKNKLLSLGMKDADATVEAGKWRQNNKFLAEDVAIRNEAAINDFGAEVIDVLKSHGGTATEEEVLNNMSGMVPVKLREQAIAKTKALLKVRGEMTPEQQMEYDYIKGSAGKRLTEFDQMHAMKVQAAQALVDKFTSISPAVQLQAAKLSSESPAGVMEALNKDAESWFGGFGSLDGREVSRFLQPQINDLMSQYHIPGADAYAIAVQAYQEAKAASPNKLGGIDEATLTDRVHAHLSMYGNRQQAIAQQNAILESGLAEKAKLVKAHDDLLFGIQKGERFSNITQQPFDSTAKFKNSIFGKDAVPATTPKEPSKTGTSKVTSLPSSEDVLARAAQIEADKAKSNLRQSAKAPAGPRSWDDVAKNGFNTGGEKSTLSITYSDGTTRQGGSAAWRNNNRGNLDYNDTTRKLGAIKADANGRAVFASEGAGDKAQERLLFEKGYVYHNMPLIDAIAKYAPARGDRRGKNDVAKYQHIVLRAVGGVNKPMKDYTPTERKKILTAIRGHEGYEKGTIKKKG